MSLIFRYPERPALTVPLARLAREELAHFEEVIAALRARGGEYRRLTPSPYAARLMTAVRTHEPAKLLDTLLCCALIEARHPQAPEGPAAQAGIRANDVIISVNDKPAVSALETMDQVAEIRPGSEIPVVIMRDDKKITLHIAVQEYPATN